jgi:hypothetical protein
LLFFFPSPGGIAGDIIEGLSNVGEVLDKSAAKVYKADKLLYFLFRLQCQPFGYSGDLDCVHFYLTVQDNNFEVFYAGMFRLPFVMSEEKLVFSEDVQNFLNYMAVLF